MKENKKNFSVGDIVYIEDPDIYDDDLSCVLSAKVVDIIGTGFAKVDADGWYYHIGFEDMYYSPDEIYAKSKDCYMCNVKTKK